MIDTNDPRFQLGMYLYEVQALYADAASGAQVNPERVKLLCERYCEAVNSVGLLRAEYNNLVRERNRVLNHAREVRRLLGDDEG